MGFVSAADWQEYKDVINEFNLDDSNLQDIVWQRLGTNLSRWGEDDNEVRTNQIIKGLVQYNYFKSWPTNQTTVSGEIDKESLLIWLNIKYLTDNGWMTTAGQFIFRSGEDRFIIRGEVYKALGDSQAAQASDEPLEVFIVLKREETETADLVYE